MMVLADSSFTINFLHWMLAIALTLLILDVFINTELLSWIAIIVFAAWLTWTIGLPIQWSVLVFVITFGITVVFYLFLWVRFVRVIVGKTLLRNAAKEVSELMVGKQGVVIAPSEEGKIMVKIGDELWPLDDSNIQGLAPGVHVAVKSCRNGFVIVEKL